MIMIKNATYTSVWDGGYEVTTNCKVNMDTKEVFAIEVSDVDADWLEVLEEEYVTIDNVNYSVSRDVNEDTEYWYE